MSQTELFPAPTVHPPSHVLAAAGDRRTLCGKKDAYPHVLDRFVQAHVDGWGMVVCPECAAVMAGETS